MSLTVLIQSISKTSKKAQVKNIGWYFNYRLLLVSLFILSVEERFLQLTFSVTFGTLDLSCYRALTAHFQSIYSTVISYLYGAERFNHKRPEIVNSSEISDTLSWFITKLRKGVEHIIHTILITSMAHTTYHTYLDYHLAMTSNLTHLFWVPETSETSESKYTLGFLPHIIYEQYWQFCSTYS